MNLSIHPALIVQHLHEEIASVQTVPTVSAVFASAIGLSIAAAIPLPMQEEGLPFLIAFVVPITVGAFALTKIIKRMNPDNDKMRVAIWQSLGIMILAQALSWLASFWFLPKYH